MHTKFDLNDTVWLMRNNKLIETTVKSITLSIFTEDISKLEMADEIITLEHKEFRFNANDLYPTKEALFRKCFGLDIIPIDDRYDHD